jgi:hypothetical protein
VRLDHIAKPHRKRGLKHHANNRDVSHILQIGTRLRADFNLFSKLRAKKSEEDGD